MGLKNSKLKNKEVPDNQKAPNRGHTYEEIDEDQLAANQESRDNQKFTSGSGGNITAPVASKPSPTIARLHPYDEVTTDQLDANREAEGAKAGKSTPKKGGAKQATSNDAAEDSDDDSPEYQNAAVIQASADSSLDNGQYITENGDVYTMPVKKPDRAQQPAKQPAKQPALNYIEVEFVPSPTKTEAKPKVSAPSNYTNVVSDNGKIVLLTQP